MNRIHLIVPALLFTAQIAAAAEPLTTSPATMPAPAVIKAEENPYLWKPKTKSVAVFKNGFGFFMAEGETTLRDGWCTASEIPPATFGTLAVYSHVDGQTVDTVGAGPGEIVEFDGRDVPDTAETRRQRLEAAKQLKVQLTYKYCEQDRSAAGKIVSVGSEYVVLAADNTNFAVPVAAISKMQMLDLPVRVHVTADAKNAKQPEKTLLGVAYLRSGITWVPAYTLRVLDDDTCELTLRGTIVNEAEDIIHADVHLVVGVPHFLHTGYMEPIAVGQAIRTIGAAIAPREIQTQIMNRSAIGNDNFIGANQLEGNTTVRPVALPAGNLAAAAGNLPQMDEAGGSDFTVYTKKDVTLRRGEKAIVTLFVKKLKYSHLYRWSPPDLMQHFLQITNDDASALTTGPCLAVSGDQPLSEDLLKYVPKNGHGEVPVTTAINLATDVTETETDRKLQAYSPQKDVNLDMVTISGELKLRNFERKPIELVLAQRVLGKPLSASDKGDLSSDSSKLTLREREGTIKWRIKLEADETKNLKYTYERYVPSN